MIQAGTCVPTPGLHRAYGVYACATGILFPQVLVDPMVRTKPGEQALVAHEMAHVEGRHALKYIIAIVVACFFTALCIIIGAAGWACVLSLPWYVSAAIFANWLAWCGNIPLFLRHCEIDADKYALERTDARTFVQFLYLHPHPKGRWGKWLYGSTLEARIQRVLPK